MSADRVVARSAPVKPTSRVTLNHGLSHHPIYRVWQSLRARCFYESCEAYPDYGGRGITVCAGWKDDPAAFIADLGPKPSDAHEIDREDNDGHYSCGHCAECVANGWKANCRWATRSQNDRNRRSNRYVEFRGERRLLIELCEQFGVPKDTVCKRLESGWDIERALTTPARAKLPNGERARLDALPRVDGRRKFTDEQREMVRRLGAEGKKPAEISRITGIERSSVKKIIQPSHRKDQA